MRVYFDFAVKRPGWRLDYQWDRFEAWLFPLHVSVDRAWVDDKQYNPLNWLRVRLWRYRHPLWISRVGVRVDRFMLDWKLGAFWLSRDRGVRGRVLLAFPAYKRALARERRMLDEVGGPQ